MADHRQDYSPATLYATGLRMVGDYTVDDAVEDYLEMHPDADAAKVREEIERLDA
jgi:ribosomal 50S subunit-associated protein YjgA (DUF615 family)